MSKNRSTVTATHRLNADEVFQIQVELGSPHPCVLDEAKDMAVAGIREMRADAVAQGFIVIETDTDDAASSSD